MDDVLPTGERWRDQGPHFRANQARLREPSSPSHIPPAWRLTHATSLLGGFVFHPADMPASPCIWNHRMVQVIDFLAVRQRRLRLTLEPAPLPHSARERAAISAACLIASKAFQQSTKCGAPEAKRILAEASHTLAAMGDEYALNEICDLAISLRTRSDQIRLPRREVRKITDIPMGLVE